MKAPAVDQIAAGRSHRTPSPDSQAVWALLAEVPDPEIPVISIVDLGIVRSVELDETSVLIKLLPTFVGCPAIEAMRAAVAERLTGFRPTVVVEVTFAEPWTSDRISPRGRARLRSSGFAPPESTAGAAVATTFVPLASLGPAAQCPYCGSRHTRLESAFGPTLCRSIHHCLDCRQPFEQFKTV
ncbi:MAG: 1,2-phenylacetyl-CoA epoxidase subunit PaaD [Candidatus Limnocylindrales bacterium]